jgi:DNA-binding NarL/FixJ family response regulator
MTPACRVVDPDLLSAGRIRNQLGRAGWRVAAEAEDPRAVVINLARGDAAQLVRDAHTRWPDARVVGFCGHADRARRDEALAAGCEVVLTHGEAMTRLRNTLARLLQGHREKGSKGAPG